MTATPEILVTHILEMNAHAEFQSAFLSQEEWAAQDALILTMAPIDAHFYRFLYREVGENWYWFLRLGWDDAKLCERHAADTLLLDVLYVGGVPAGFVELAIREENANEAGAIEIAYFGIREAFFGRGLGKHLLSHGIQAAWEIGARRVWLSTCNLDAPQALSNYLKRGFQIAETIAEPMPALYRD